MKVIPRNPKEGKSFLKSKEFTLPITSSVTDIFIACSETSETAGYNLKVFYRFHGIMKHIMPSLGVLCPSPAKHSRTAAINGQWRLTEINGD